MMQPFFSRYHTTTRPAAGDDKFSFLRRVFPSIQLGRDIDLEMYVQLRSGGREEDKWKRHYDRLARKYTPEECKVLIHVLRKYNNDFNRIFGMIIDRLYRRVVKNFEQKIDLILGILGNTDSETVSSEQEKVAVVEKIKKSLAVCSLNHAKALDDLDLLGYYAATFDYKRDVFARASDLIRLYLDGLLFVEKVEYKFDIREEKRNFLGITQSRQHEVSSLRLYISQADLERIIIDDNLDNEYDLAFAFYEKYFSAVRDVNFANKLFLYSQTYKTNHYRIFECIKRGLEHHFRKERIFDDIFKVICDGRYVYDINREKQMQKRIWLFAKTLDKARRIGRMEERRKKMQTGKQFPEAIPGPVPVSSSAAATPAPVPVSSSAAATPIQVSSSAAKPVTVASSVVPKKPKSGNQSVSEMIAVMAESQKDQHILTDEYKNRLSGYALKYFQDLPGIDLEKEEDFRRFKEFIRYALHNYDTIITDPTNEKKFDKELQTFGFNINLFYTIIFECFMDLKSDYLLRPARKKSPPGIFEFFSRLFGRKK